MSGSPRTGLRFLSSNARWQNDLFYKCCYHYTAFRSTSDTGDENFEIPYCLARLIFFIVVQRWKTWEGNTKERSEEDKDTKGVRYENTKTNHSPLNFNGHCSQLLCRTEYCIKSKPIWNGEMFARFTALLILCKVIRSRGMSGKPWIYPVCVQCLGKISIHSSVEQSAQKNMCTHQR
jgi:hypothetical protein